MNRLVDAKASRREMDIDSVKALAEFLRKVAAAPDDFKADAKLLAALRSQGSLAKHAVPEASVHSMSLNHQRLIAQIALGDYVSLDSLRRVALNALKSEELSFQRSNKQSKAGLAVVQLFFCKIDQAIPW
jgi:hypothetical protein